VRRAVKQLNTSLNFVTQGIWKLRSVWNCN